MATKKTATNEPVRHISDTEMANDARSTAEILRAQPRVRFTIMPDGSGDKKIRVKINGTAWEYWVGREQEAPKDVFALIATKYATIAQADEFKRKTENSDLGRL